MANISKIAVGGTEYDIAGVGLIATIETTLTASKTYNVGDQFIYNGLLYKVTQTIASGTAITIGSNCQLAPVVADQLSEINSNLSSLITTDDVTYTATSIASQGSVIISEDATKSGCTPIGIVDVKHAYNSDLLLAEMYIDSSTLKARYRNVGTSTITNVTFTFTVLYLKTI